MRKGLWWKDSQGGSSRVTARPKSRPFNAVTFQHSLQAMTHKQQIPPLRFAPVGMTRHFPSPYKGPWWSTYLKAMFCWQ